MCKLIGISGLRKSGRKTAAWLLAEAIEDIKRGRTFEQFKIQHEARVKLVILDPNEACSTNHCIIDSFGQYILDQVTAMCPALIGHYLHDHEEMSRTWISPKTFDITRDQFEPNKILTAQEYFDYTQDKRALDTDIYMSVDEFVMYYAKYVMKTFFGDNIWLHSIKQQNELVASDDIRIYWDVKTQAELDYISGTRGKIISLISSNRQIQGGYKDIYSFDPDFTLDTTEGLTEAAEQFWNIANDILK